MVKTHGKSKIVPVVDQQGFYARVHVPPVGEMRGGYTTMYQVVGGPLQGERGTLYDLENRVGRDNVERAESYEVVDEATGRLLQPKLLELTLAANEHLQLVRIAQERGVGAADLIEAFIADLTESSRNNGSDERMFARQWLDRVVWPGSYDNNTTINDER